VTAHHDAAGEILSLAAYIASVDAANFQLIHGGSHAIYRLPKRIVASVGRPGTINLARREVAVSHWLAQSGLSVVETVPDLPQPVVVDERPVTWWRSLPTHRPATPAQLGAVLRSLHAVPIPTAPQLPEADPLAELDDRIGHAGGEIDAGDKEWLIRRVASLRQALGGLPCRRARRVIHGDVRRRDVVVLHTGRPVLLGLEHIAVGCPGWDLVPLAADFIDFARIRKVSYQSFVRAYGGYDVMKSPHFQILADIHELRWACRFIGDTATSATARRTLHYRIACIRGEISRPWELSPVDASRIGPTPENA
jgi:phosphotransferase family enzyme